MRLTPGRGFIVVLIAAVAVAAAFADVGASRSCGDADASRDNGMLTDAQKAYAAVLKEEPTSDCAKDGMAEVAKKLCKRAAAVEAAGRADDSKKIYTAALVIEPSDQIPDDCKAPAQ
jgi:hypothetical protein